MPDTFLLGLAGVAGIATHLLYFHKGEHHLYGVRYLQIALAVFATFVAGLIRIGERSFGEAFVTVAAYEGSFFVGLYASLLIYRAFLNPLNKFPGPFSTKFTNFWYVSQIKGLNAHKVLLKLHGKYGDFLRIGSGDLSIIHPDSVNAVYGLGSKCTKSTWYDNDSPLLSLHTTRGRALHDRRRRVWSPAFSDKALRGYEDRIRGYGDKLIQEIGNYSGQAVDVTKWFNLYSFDVMGDLAFGKSFNMLETGEEHWAIKLLNEGMEPVGFNLPPWFFRTLIAIPGLAAGYWKFINYCAERLDARMESKVDTPDIIAALIEPFKGRKPDPEEMSMLQGDTRLIIVAGSDTTAATLTHLFYHLALDPTQVDKLREELMPLVEADGDVQHTKIQNAEHLNGVINETLRLNPPVPTAIHRLTPPQGIEIGGKFIPGNTNVFCPQYVVSRNEEIYKNAKAFYPERWYKDTDMVTNKTAFAPFSQGVYGCIGKPLALMEIRTVVTKLLVKYDVKFAPGEDGSGLIDGMKDHFTMGLQPLNLQFTKRRM